MSGIGTERVEPTAQVVERRGGGKGLHERGPRSPRPPAAAAPPDPEPSDPSDTTPHQVDSLA
jgi:hypothetical protein